MLCKNRFFIVFFCTSRSGESARLLAESGEEGTFIHDFGVQNNLFLSFLTPFFCPLFCTTRLFYLEFVPVYLGVSTV